jgi:predicted O-methyltransferase YrrM
VLTQIARLRFELGTRRLVTARRRELQRATGEAQTAAEAVDVAFTPAPAALNIAPVQVRSEIIRFIDLVEEHAPRRVLEIGTSNGGTLFLLGWASADDASILSLDVKTFSPDRLRIYGAFGRPRQRVVVRRADSHDRATADAVRAFFGGAPLDLLFIDGDHAYDSVRRDYEVYSPLVRPDGLIALHDIVDGDETKVGGVPRFWREIRDELVGATEIVESWTQGAFGIGVGRPPDARR